MTKGKGVGEIDDQETKINEDKSAISDFSIV